MQAAILEDVLSDEDFLEKLLESRSGNEVKYELSRKGINLKEEDLGKFCGILADKLERRLIEREMNRVAGGTGSIGKSISQNPELERKLKNLNNWVTEISKSF